MDKRPKFNNTEEYISTFPDNIKAILNNIRKQVKKRIPDASETISYQMPAFRQKKVFFFYAAFKNHIGIYPPVKGDKQLHKDLQPYRNEKGNLKFPLAQAIPYDLIVRVAESLAAEYHKNQK